jgi:spore germination protein D
MKLTPTIFYSLFLIAAISLLSSCTPAYDEKEPTINYKELKSMVLDIMQTEEGRTILKEGLKAPDIKSSLILDNEQIKGTIQATFLNGKNQIGQLMREDPKFAAEIARSLQNDVKRLFIDLQKDPEYQKTLLQLFQNPEFEGFITQTMKNREYREHMKVIIRETLQSPYFKEELFNIVSIASESFLKKSFEKELKKPKNENNQPSMGSEDSTSTSSEGEGNDSTNTFEPEVSPTP